MRAPVCVVSLAMSLMISGCQMSTSEGAIPPPPKTPIEGAPTRPLICQAWLPISWSAADTDQTILEVKQNNAAWACACEGECDDEQRKQDQ